MAKNVKYQVLSHFRTPCGAEIRPEKFSKIFSQLIYVSSNRKIHKMLIFFNLMCLAHDISRKTTKKGSSVLFKGLKMDCTSFNKKNYDSSLKYTPSSMIYPMT